MPRPKQSSILRTAEGNPVPEKLSWTYYDTQLVAAGAIVGGTPYTLFTVARGQAGNGFVPKTNLHTNMQQPAQLPANHQFIVRGITVKAIGIVAVGPVFHTMADMLQVFGFCDFVFNLVSKSKLELALGDLPGGNQVAESGAPVVASPTNGWPTFNNYYPLKTAIALDAVQTFNVVITWRQATVVNLTTPLWLKVNLHGTLYRPTQ